jgi:hypothetical protein
MNTETTTPKKNALLEAFPQLEKAAMRQVIKYAVQKQMFCDFTNVILDMRTCILIEVKDSNDRDVLNKVISPSCIEKLQDVVNNVAAIKKDYVVKFYSSNKAFKNNSLITLV